MLLNLPGDMGIKKIVSAKCWISRMYSGGQTKRNFFLVCTSICAQANAEGYERNKTENY